MGAALVVADSSVLITYARAGRLPVLRDVFGALEIPLRVEQESVGRAADRPGALALQEAIDGGWVVVVKEPRGDALARRHPNLGRGEVAAIALARARPGALLLVDDGLARQVARLEGVPVAGSLGVLARANRRGVLKSPAAVEDALRSLLRSGLWLAPDIVEDFRASLLERA